MFILRKLHSTFKFEYKFTYKNIVVGIQCEAQNKRLVLEKTVPLETALSAIHDADDRNKVQSVLPVYCLDMKHNLRL